MASISGNKQCAHAECSCPATAFGGYCSPACQAKPDASTCECGHPECQATSLRNS